MAGDDDFKGVPQTGPSEGLSLGDQRFLMLLRVRRHKCGKTTVSVIAIFMITSTRRTSLWPQGGYKSVVTCPCGILQKVGFRRHVILKYVP